VSIAYDVAGSGPVVVFLHGIGGNRTNWGEQLEAFSQQFCAVAWDARGYGASNDSPTTLRFSDYADDLQRLLDHLKADTAQLVGLSMGGMIIQDFYARYPQRVATLALVDTSPGFATAPEEAKRDFLARRLEPLEKGLKPADFAPALVEVLVAPGAPPPVREQLRASLAMLRPEPYKQALKAIVTTDFRAVLAKISVPTLVIVGEEDQLTTPATAEYLAKSIPGAEKVVITGAGHLTNIEQPQVFNSALGAFLGKHANRASGVAVA
jgi:pimeloyl-ACP methyl ester carboxylesterase